MLDLHLLFTYTAVMIRVGTCGFRHRDWVPAFYPRALNPGSWLSHYSQRFGCCELGFTTYRVPEPQVVHQLMEGSGARLRFVFRAPTVLLQPQPPEEAARQFASALWPLVEAGQLAGVVLRFAASYAFNRENFATLRLLRRLLSGMRLIAEFASPGWGTPAATRHLSAEDIATACVDGCGPPHITACPGYFRFDGRNQSRWLEGDGSSRHDYLYTAAELAAAVPEIRRLESEAGSVLVLMNNPWRGHAAVNALTMQELLGNAGSG